MRRYWYANNMIMVYSLVLLKWKQIYVYTKVNYQHVLFTFTITKLVEIMPMLLSIFRSCILYSFILLLLSTIYYFIIGSFTINNLVLDYYLEYIENILKHDDYTKKYWLDK